MTPMSKSKRADGWWYPWIFVAGFCIVFPVNGLMAYFAVSTWTGLETKDYFNQGKSYNDVLEQRARQDALGWKVDFGYENVPVTDDPRAGVFRLHFTDKADHNLNNLYISAIAKRPTQEGYDQELIFTYKGKGTYVAKATLALPGLWELRYTATRGDDLFKMRSRVQIQ